MGLTLLRAAEDLAREAHARHRVRQPASGGGPALYLHVDATNGAARALYQRAGFDEVGLVPGAAAVAPGGAAASPAARAWAPSLATPSASPWSRGAPAAAVRFTQRLGLRDGALARVDHCLLVRHVPCD